MPDRRNALTPEALAMMDAIARSGSFAAAARELGKVPSALTYSVRQLEDALDVLLFDRSSRQAQLTAAGEELLHEGRRLLSEIDAVANRVRRVACGWETQLEIVADDIISQTTLFELVESFCQLRPDDSPDSNSGPGTRLRLRTEVLAGTWEALVSGQRRPRHRRRRRRSPTPAASRCGRSARCPSCSSSRRTTRWRAPSSRSSMRNSCSTARSRSPTPRTTWRR